jgi:alpha-1,4-digalacturonate transport system permease protein
MPRKLAPYLFILPTVAIFSTFIVWPAAQGFYQSLFERGIIVSPEFPALSATFVGLDNFVALFRDARFLGVLGRTVVYTVLVVPLTIVVSLLLALLLKEEFTGVALARAVVYWPTVAGMIIVGISWRWILRFESGIISFLLESVGLERQPWLQEPALAFISVVFVAIWATAGFFMILFIGGLQAIPHTYYEAAIVDGASTLERFLYVTVPLLQPTILLVMVLSTINAFKVFDQIIVLTEGGPGRSTVMLVQNMYQEAFTRPEGVGYASAQSVVFLLIMVIFTLLQFRLSRSGGLRE